LYRIFPSGFIRIGRLRRSYEVKLTLGLEQPGYVRLVIEDLEAYQVEMNGMGVVGGVDQTPDLGGSQNRVLRDGIFQWEAFRSNMTGLPALLTYSFRVSNRV